MMKTGRSWLGIALAIAALCAQACDRDAPAQAPAPKAPSTAPGEEHAQARGSATAEEDTASRYQDVVPCRIRGFEVGQDVPFVTLAFRGGAAEPAYSDSRFPSLQHAVQVRDGRLTTIELMTPHADGPRRETHHLRYDPQGALLRHEVRDALGASRTLVLATGDEGLVEGDTGEMRVRYEGLSPDDRHRTHPLVVAGTLIVGQERGTEPDGATHRVAYDDSGRAIELSIDLAEDLRFRYELAWTCDS